VLSKEEVAVFSGQRDRKIFARCIFFLGMQWRVLYPSNANSLYFWGRRRAATRGASEFRIGGREYKLSSISLPAQLPSRAIPTAKKKIAKLTLWPLVAATFFMVSGGTYGTEEIIHGAGYGHGILILLFLPVLWCLPTAFMIGELSSALPQEGVTTRGCAAD